ncbi:MAG TPA: hypothetical protein VE964_05540, partial [Myxococcales bacterium]|nr:hypothetical protein [Myxococcales bacterium]
MTRRNVVGAALLATAIPLIVFASCSGESTSSFAKSQRGTAVTHDPVVVVTGDIACTGGDPGQIGGSNQACAERDFTDASGVFHRGTGTLASSLNPDYVILLGDIQYPNGSQQDFLNSPATAFGAFTPHWWGKPNLTPDKFFPSPGNHD